MACFELKCQINTTAGLRGKMKEGRDEGKGRQGQRMIKLLHSKQIPLVPTQGNIPQVRGPEAPLLSDRQVHLGTSPPPFSSLPCLLDVLGLLG